MSIIYKITIPNDEERFTFAQQVRKIFDHSNTYIPHSEQSDIGVQATCTEKQYKKVIALLDRRGYTYKLIQE